MPFSFASFPAVSTFPATTSYPAGWDVDGLAFSTAAGLTNPTHMTAVDNLVKGLKSANIWTALTLAYPFVGGTAASHSINLKTPGSFSISWSNSPTHDANGVTGNALLNGDTSFVPLGTLTKPSCSYGFYTRNTVSLTGIVIGEGAGSGGAARFYARSVVDQFQFFCGAGATTNGLSQIQTTGIGNRGNGCWISTHGVADNKLFRNGSLLSTDTTNIVSSVLPALTMKILNGVDANLAFAFFGGLLSDTAAVNLNNLIQSFQVTLGRSI